MVSLRRARKPVKPAELLEAALPVFCRKEPAHVSEPWPGGRGGHLCDLRGRVLPSEGPLCILRTEPDDAGLHDHQKGRPPGRDRLP